MLIEPFVVRRCSSAAPPPLIVPRSAWLRNSVVVTGSSEFTEPFVVEASTRAAIDFGSATVMRPLVVSRRIDPPGVTSLSSALIPPFVV